MEDDVAKYRKKKPQKSKSRKRADHKHEYVKCIDINVNIYNPQIKTCHWSERCKFCGRLGNYNFFDNKDFLKPEFRDLPSGFYDMDKYIPVEEVLEMYPDLAVYISDPMDPFNKMLYRPAKSDEIHSLTGGNEK